MDKAALSPAKSPDEWGMVGSGLTMILAAFKVPEAIGLDANEWVAVLGGAAFVFAGIRAIGRRWLASRGM
jgi:hypothetical protein